MAVIEEVSLARIGRADSRQAYLVRGAQPLTQRMNGEEDITELLSSLAFRKLTPPSTRTRNLIDCHYTALLRLLQHSHEKGAYPHILAEVIRRSMWKEDRERFHSAVCVLQDLHLDDDISWTPYIETVCAICDNETSATPQVPDYRDQDGLKVGLYGAVFGTTALVVVMFLCMRLYGWLMAASLGSRDGFGFGAGTGPHPRGPH